MYLSKSKIIYTYCLFFPFFIPYLVFYTLFYTLTPISTHFYTLYIFYINIFSVSFSIDIFSSHTFIYIILINSATTPIIHTIPANKPNIHNNCKNIDIIYILYNI